LAEARDKHQWISFTNNLVGYPKTVSASVMNLLISEDRWGAYL
jgi:hypothetical protein